jgi:hypothetical protein
MNVLPEGYTLKGKFASLSKHQILLVSVLALMLSFGTFSLFTVITKLFRPGFDLYGMSWAFFYTLLKINSPALYVELTLVFTTVLYANVYAHEGLHGILDRLFTGKWPEILVNFLSIDSTAMRTGVFCSRNRAVLTSLGPLIILGLLWLTLWAVVDDNFLPFVMFFLAMNVSAAAGDIYESFWLKKYPGNYVFGFDGQTSVVYGPDRAGKELPADIH